MNNIFLKNIQSLARKNPILANALMTYIPTELPEITQVNGHYNLKYKNKLIHNGINPLEEAKEIFHMATNEPNSIHLIYGLGLGYLFQYTSLNSKGTVILYEEDLNIIWFSFSMVDFSNDIIKENVFFTNDYDYVVNEIYKKSAIKNSPQMLVLPTTREENPEKFNILVKQLQEVIGSFALDLQYTEQKLYKDLKLCIKNIPYIIDEIPVNKLKDIYKGKTAVIVSAGPTLDRNIEVLKKYRDKFVLFTVGTALKALYNKGLKPDFLCIIEAYNSFKHVEGLDLSDVNYITEPHSNPATRKVNYKRRFSHISANSPVNHFWSELSGENIEEYWSKGTVSYTALNCARIMGCSKLILVGQDLAYIEGQCYSKDSIYKDLVCKYNENREKWEITAKNMDEFINAISASKDINVREKAAKNRLDKLNNALYYVKGINGDMLPTEVVYAAFLKPLSEFAEKFSDREYINTSLVGAQIDGYKNMSLEDALASSETFEKIEHIKDFSYKKESIKANLELKLNELNKSLEYINQALKQLKNIKNNLNRYKNINEDILKTLKKVSQNYLYLSDEFAKKSKMYDFITISDKIKLDYKMKMLENFSYKNVVEIVEALCSYYKNAEIKINEINGLINGVINESLNTKS